MMRTIGRRWPLCFGNEIFSMILFLILLNNFSTNFVFCFNQKIDGLSRCQSCSAVCQYENDSRHCDCSGSESDLSGYCTGEFCYVQLINLDDDNQQTAGVIRKGCVNEPPTSFLKNNDENKECQYINNNQTIGCYCRGDFCNDRKNLDDYRITKQLPLVQCCECEGIEPINGTIDCLPQECLRNCTGNYCFNDIQIQSQGCGWGYPQVEQFIRRPRKTNQNQNLNGNDNASLKLLSASFDQETNMTCIEAFGGFDGAQFIRGCTCASDFCNLGDRANFYARNETELRTEPNEYYCYAVHAVSVRRPLTGDVYKQSTLCPGHFCFVTYTTTSLGYVGGKNDSHNNTILSLPKLINKYELTAGCLLVDDSSKVQTGCSIEWSSTTDKPTSKHCICASHDCNYFNLISGQDRRSLLSFDWRIFNYKTLNYNGATNTKNAMLSLFMCQLLISLYSLLSR